MMSKEMDETGNDPQNTRLLHSIFNFVRQIGCSCPVRNALAICRRLFNFTASTAEDLIPRSWTVFLLHVLFIVERIYNSIMRTVVAQAMKPVTLGSPLHYSLTEAPNLHPALSQNEPKLHEDCSDEMDHYLMHDARQVKAMDSSAGTPPLFGSTCNSVADERDSSQLNKGIDVDVHTSSSIQDKGDEETPQERAIPPAEVLQAKAPKKMVSINENVETYPISMKNKMLSKEWLSSREGGGEVSKPLKSILKVGSKRRWQIL